MTYKNMQVGDVVQIGDEDSPAVIRGFEVNEDGKEDVLLQWPQTGHQFVLPPLKHLYPWSGAQDLDVRPEELLTPDWMVHAVRTSDGRVQLARQNAVGGTITEWLDIRLARLPERMWMIQRAIEWRSVDTRRKFSLGAVVRLNGPARDYPLGVVITDEPYGGLVPRVRVLFADEPTEVECQNLEAVAQSMSDLHEQRRMEQARLKEREDERDNELDDFKKGLAVRLAAVAAQNGWEDTTAVFDALNLDEPNPRVEFELTVKVRLLATRTGGDPGDELKESFLANSFSVGMVNGDVAVYPDADLDKIDIVPGSATFVVDAIERAK